jgi:hypothetical protein
MDLGPLMPLAFRVADPGTRVTGDVATGERPSERLPERPKHVVPGPGRDLLAPVLDLDLP